MTLAEISSRRITKRQQQYYDAVVSVWSRTGRCGIQDLCNEVGVNSTSSAHCALQRLCRAGLVKRVPYGNFTLYKPGNEPDQQDVNALLEEIRRRIANDEEIGEWMMKYARAWQ